MIEWGLVGEGGGESAELRGDGDATSATMAMRQV